MQDIEAIQILIPILPMVALVFMLFFGTIISRVTQMKRNRVHPQQVQSRVQMAERVRDSRASDHLANLFEAPILFYVACVLIFLLGIQDSLSIALAWLFVTFRYIQAAIHLSVNHVLTRATVFGLGLLTLAVLWLRIAVALLSG